MEPRALACLRQSARFWRSMALLDPAVGLAAALLAPAFGAVTVGDDWAAAAPAGNAAAAIPNIDANRDMTRIRLPGRNSSGTRRSPATEPGLNSKPPALYGKPADLPTPVLALPSPGAGHDTHVAQAPQPSAIDKHPEQQGRKSVRVTVARASAPAVRPAIRGDAGMKSALMLILSSLPFWLAAPTRRQVAVMRLRRRTAGRQRALHAARVGSLA